MSLLDAQLHDLRSAACKQLDMVTALQDMSQQSGAYDDLEENAEEMLATLDQIIDGKEPS